MDISTIVKAALSLGAMGLFLGAGLAYASQKFAVEIDERAIAVRAALPSANCGGCGYAGCDAFANAVVSGEAAITGCPVGGQEVVEQLAIIMGVTADTSVKQVAHVICKGGSCNAKKEYDYSGIADCRAAHALNGGDLACKYGCMGYGSCVAVCEFDAIHINENNIAEVDPEKCTACGACLEICPKDVIQYVPYGQEVIVNCNNKQKGGMVKKNCKVACIACKICEKNCPVGAIKVIDNVAQIDYDICIECMICVNKCPTKAIAGQFNLEK